jgi:uncharacterized protein (TIGR02271 family)
MANQSKNSGSSREHNDTTSNTQRGDNTDRNVNTSGKAIPIIEEELQVGKREVEKGGARVQTHVTEKPVEANVTLREEHVNVERHPVNREATESDLANFKEGEINVKTRAEEAVVNKQARVVEEVEIGKQVQERQETVRDTVRRTDVDVEETDTDRADNDARRANS